MGWQHYPGSVFQWIQVLHLTTVSFSPGLIHTCARKGSSTLSNSHLLWCWDYIPDWKLLCISAPYLQTGSGRMPQTCLCLGCAGNDCIWTIRVLKLARQSNRDAAIRCFTACFQCVRMKIKDRDGERADRELKWEHADMFDSCVVHVSSMGRPEGNLKTIMKTGITYRSETAPPDIDTFSSAGYGEMQQGQFVFFNLLSYLITPAVIWNLLHFYCKTIHVISSFMHLIF